MSMKLEAIPEKRILPPEQGMEVTLRKYDWMLFLLKGQFDDIDPEKRPTAIDFQGLREGSAEEDFLKWINRELDIDPEMILKNGDSPESKDVYKVLDYAYQQGKNFLKDTLKYKDEEINIGPASITSKKDIFDLMKKTVLVNGQKGLSRSLLYCRLVKATIVAYETLKNDAEVLKEATAVFENSMVAPVSVVRKKEDTPLVLTKEDSEGKKFYAASHGGLRGSIASRGKDLERAMLRYITRVEANAATALKDGIASRITIDRDKAVELAPILAKWLTGSMKAGFITVENKSFLSEEQKAKLGEYLSEVLSKNEFMMEEGDSNPTSMGDFEALLIKGILQPVEKDGKFITLAQSARQFEIQLVAPDNKNETGKMDHYTYNVVKFVTARTRLDGACPESVFLEFVKDAAKLSGKSERTIIHNLTETENSPVVKVRKPGKARQEYNYVAHSVYSRWNGFGWVDSALFSEVEEAKNLNEGRK